MKRFIYCVAVMLVGTVAVHAQKQFTLEDLNFGGKNYSNMVPKNKTLMWCGNQLMHTEKDSIWTVDTKNGKEKLAFTAQQVQEWAGLEKSPNLKWASFPYPDKSLMLINTPDKRMLVDVKKHKLEWSQSTKGETNEDWNKASRNVAFVKDDNLYITTADGKTTQITTDGSRDIVYAQSVHRNEFGIEKGTFWANKGDKLAFYRMDHRLSTHHRA